MEQSTIAWIAFGVYLVVTAGLAVIGWLKTDSLESFAVGKRDMGPWLVGITMGAAMSSTATFVINPGFVYAHGISAFVHLGVAVGIGIAVALAVMSPTFRRVGVDGHALTLPHWIGARYGSTALRVIFGLISLMSIAFLVLIAGSVQILLQQTLQMSPDGALLLTIGFVFSYILIGGTYAHTYTNSLQGMMMVLVTLIILVKTAGALTTDGFWAMLEARDANLLATINPDSTLYGDFFSVYVAGFVIGFAVVCQPHLLMKALYLEKDEDVGRYVMVSVGVTAIFFTLLLGGLAAHAVLDPAAADAVRQDAVMVAWLETQFGEVAFVLISVALVAAGMSTLDGILVAMSTVVSNDVYLPIAGRTILRDLPAEAQARSGYRFGQAVLVMMGIVTYLFLVREPPGFLLALADLGVVAVALGVALPVIAVFAMPADHRLRPRVIVGATVVGLMLVSVVAILGIEQRPPKLLGIFGQTGVYGIIAAAVGPILIGVSLPRRSDLRPLALTISVVGFLSYVALNTVRFAASGADANAGGFGAWWLDFAQSNPVLAGTIAHPNPAVPATLSILLSAFIAAVWLTIRRPGRG